MSGIVVGVDGSPSSLSALDWALTEAAARGTALTVLAVAPVAVGAFGIAAERYPADEEDRKKVEQATRESVDAAAAQRSGGAAADVTIRAVSGLPVDELLKASRDADMLVVGARGAGGFARLLLGSVSSKLTHYAQCPVVIVPGERAA
jgi:nucleotide-binding universal stress UspA family protein